MNLIDIPKRIDETHKMVQKIARQIETLECQQKKVYEMLDTIMNPSKYIEREKTES